MADVAAVLKAEIPRIARKEMRGDFRLTKDRQRLPSPNCGIEAANRGAGENRQTGGQANAAGSVAAREAKTQDQTAHRFNAKGLAAHRHRLLSAFDFARLIDVSALSVYKWKTGKTRPRARQIEKIALVRTIGKREALARLEQASAGSRSNGRGGSHR